MDIHETNKHDKLCACCQHLPSIHVCPPGTENTRSKLWDSVPASVSLLTPDSCPRPSVSIMSSSGLAMSGCVHPEPGLVHTAIPSFQLGPPRSSAGLASCHGPGRPLLERPRVGSGRPATVARAWGAADSSRVAETRCKEGTTGTGSPCNRGDPLRSPTAPGGQGAAGRSGFGRLPAIPPGLGDRHGRS